MRRYTYTVKITPGENRGFVATVPVLPGCVTFGTTYAEAVSMAEEAILCCLEGMVKDGERIPLETEPVKNVAVTVEINSPVMA